MTICSVEGCGTAARARGWCPAHYQRWRKYGSPLAGGTSLGQPLRHLHEVVLAYDGDECLIWPFAKGVAGYGRLRVNGRSVIVSRIVCELAHGEPPTPKHEAAHSCGRGHKGCCTKRHLSWKTPAQNTADKFEHGTVKRGKDTWNAALTEDDVRAIRALKGKRLQTEIASDYGVARTTVSAIQNGYRWAWLEAAE